MKLPTTPEEYKAARERLGTQAEVAEALGINRVTLANRERGAAGYPITTEAALAIMALPVPRRKK